MVIESRRAACPPSSAPRTRMAVEKSFLAELQGNARAGEPASGLGAVEQSRPLRSPRLRCLTLRPGEAGWWMAPQGLPWRGESAAASWGPPVCTPMALCAAAVEEHRYRIVQHLSRGAMMNSGALAARLPEGAAAGITHTAAHSVPPGLTQVAPSSLLPSIVMMSMVLLRQTSLAAAAHDGELD